MQIEVAEFGEISGVHVAVAPAVRAALRIGGPNDIADSQGLEQVVAGELQFRLVGGGCHNRAQQMVARAAIRSVLAGVFPHGHRKGEAHVIRRALHLLHFQFAGLEAAFEARFHVHHVGHRDAALPGVRIRGTFLREEAEQRLVHPDQALAHRDARQNRGDAFGHGSKVMLAGGVVGVEIGVKTRYPWRITSTL